MMRQTADVAVLHCLVYVASWGLFLDVVRSMTRQFGQYTTTTIISRLEDCDE